MLKYYLRGLGIGIVVTTLILTVVFNLRGKLSDSEIKERAAKLGMVMPESTADSIFDKTTSDKENQTPDKTTADEQPDDKETTPEPTTEEQTPEPTAEEQTPEPTTEEQTTEPTTPEPTTEEQTPEPTTEEPPAPVVNSVNIEIRSGMYSEAVSRLLFESGIIPNSAEFNLYLENNGYAERIAVGTFTVSSDMSYEQLARIITRS